VVEYSVPGGETVQAVSGISLEIGRGQTLGLVGESGCGKSSLGRAVTHSPAPTSGSVEFAQRDLALLSAGELRRLRPRMQMIFQDPISSLNPRRRVADIVGDPLSVWGRRGERDEAVPRLLERVGLDPASGARRPHEFSGGQCQRISIARALVLGPELLICDEPVSALDVSVQAQILNLLEELKADFGLTMLFISHDLGVVRNISDRVAVMYLGRLCEIGDSVELFDEPLHPYTLLLLSSLPGRTASTPDGAAERDRPAEMPSARNPPSGCRFRTRCPLATEMCAEVTPEMREVRPGRYVACHHPLVPTTATAV
jgi:peptide/nickel transport system ATP-binding protein